MKPVRYSVRTFLIGVAVLAACFGALESNSAWVVSLVYSLNLALLSLALVGALAACGARRLFWIGFAVFGCFYSLVAMGFVFPGQQNYYYPWAGTSLATERPQLMTSRLLDVYASLRAPRSIGDKVRAQWSGGSYWPATIVAYKDGLYLVDWEDSSPNEWVSTAKMQPMGRDLERVGHSIFSLLLGFLGGLLAVCCFGPRAEQTAPRDGEERLDARSGDRGNAVAERA